MTETPHEKSHRLMLGDLKSGEKAYPIYSISAKWSEDQPIEPHPASWCEGLPEGRFWNRTGWSTMYSAERSPDEIKAEATNWWPKYIVDKKISNPSDLEITIKLVHWEVWCEGWFSHWTFDVGMSDSDVIASFGRYVDRMLAANQHEGEFRKREDGTEYWHEPYCLMGAEDRYRWCGSADGSPTGEHTDPPCRCEHCKKAGRVVIGH